MTVLNTDYYPKIIQDFFLFDQSQSDGSAHTPIALPFQYDSNVLLEEANRLPYDDRTVARCYVWGPTGQEDPGCDLLSNHGTEYSAQIDLSNYPAIQSFISNCKNVGDITYMTFKKMKPRGFITPHVDSECNSLKVYVPLTWPAGSCFKIWKHGKVDFTSLQPNIINTGKHMHSVVNDSDEPRIIFSFYPDWSSDGWRQILDKTEVQP